MDSSTKVIFKKAEDVITMNWVWCIPASCTMILCIILVRTSKPPSPPSKSAEVDQASIPYFTRMKMLATNKNYVVINIAIGGAVGFFNCLATQLQQFMCSRGYSSEFSGKTTFVSNWASSCRTIFKHA